jgi:hypothetical protein
LGGDQGRGIAGHMCRWKEVRLDEEVRGLTVVGLDLGW